MSNDFKETKKALSNSELILDMKNTSKQMYKCKNQNKYIFIPKKYSIKSRYIKKIDLIVNTLIQRFIVFFKKSGENKICDVGDSKILAFYAGMQLNMFFCLGL